MNDRVYLDNAATTRLHPEVWAEMESAFARFGNPSSVHREGRDARLLLQRARERVAGVLGVEPSEVVFTSSASESDNLALLGASEHLEQLLGRKLVLGTTRVEHKAVLATIEHLRRRGHAVVLAEVDGQGRVDEESLRRALADRPVDLFSMMLANNEVGSVQPVADCARWIEENAEENRAFLHCDATQGAGKLDVQPASLGADLLTLSAHKIHGPRGAGVLVARSGTPLRAQIHGGGHESGRRSGTENVAAAVGFAAALEIAARDRVRSVEHMERLRSRLRDGLCSAVPQLQVLADDGPRLPSILCVGVEGVLGEALVVGADLAGIAISSGSACDTHSVQVSHVLVAMGLDEPTAASVVRLSLAADSTDEDVDRAIERLPGVVDRLRAAR